MNKVLEVRQLSKNYGRQTALDRLDFSVASGEVFALLGPNGAGKTSCLEIIEGIRQADQGSVLVCGVDAVRHPQVALRHMGVQLQTQGLPPSMTVEESLVFFSRYQGCEPRRELLERFGLESKAKATFSQLSMGLQRRLMLALALAHDPEIIILDEPTASLDVESRDTLHGLIREEQARGKTIVLASHDMAEVEKLADRALVLVRGRLAAIGSPRQLTTQGDCQTRLSVLTRDGCLNAQAHLIPGAEVDAEGYLKLRSASPGPQLQKFLASIEAANDEILDLRVERPSLEERFLQLTGSPMIGDME